MTKSKSIKEVRDSYIEEDIKKTLESHNMMVDEMTEVEDEKPIRKSEMEQIGEAKLQAIFHQAKKNICTEIEYLKQIILEQNIRCSLQFEGFVQQQNIYLQQSDTASNRYTLSESNTIFKFLSDATIFLEQIQKNTLSKTSGASLKEIKELLFVSGCQLERIRLYLDDFIYPRDLTLNLIDIDIDLSFQERRKAVHFSVKQIHQEYSDFFNSYNTMKKIITKIRFLEKEELEILNQSTEQDSSDFSQNLNLYQNNQTQNRETKKDVYGILKNCDIEEMKKYLNGNIDGHQQKKEQLRSIADSFSPSLLDIYNIPSSMHKNFSLVLQILNINLQNCEVSMTLFKDQMHPISNQAIIDPCLFFGQEKTLFVFLEIPFQYMIKNNLVLIIKVLDNKQVTQRSETYDILETNPKSEYSTIRDYKQIQYHIDFLNRGFSILPLSKMFWKRQIKNGVFKTITGNFFKPNLKHIIEDKYTYLQEKKSLKTKLRDEQLTDEMQMQYQFKMYSPYLSYMFRQSKLDLNQYKDAILVKKFSFETKDNLVKDKDLIQRMTKKDEYRFNDVRIELRGLGLTNEFCKKSPITRIEIALRDKYGFVYDTIYMTNICESQIQFVQMFESMLYMSTTDVKLHEQLYVRIPTKSLESLKKLHLIFFIQVLASKKDSKGNKIKHSNYQCDLENLKFKTQYVGILPLYDNRKDQESILKNKEYIVPMHVMDMEKFKKFKRGSSLKHFECAKDISLRIFVSVISNEFTHNKFINNLMSLQPKTKWNLMTSQYGKGNFFQNYEKVLSQLKELKTAELISFHDKILDKLFQILTFSRSPSTQDLIFETVIQIIKLFHQDYQDYKQLLNQYVYNHFAHQKAYISLVYQLRQVAQIVSDGFKENENEEYFLATMKYISIVLRLTVTSFEEDQQCNQISEESSASARLEEYRKISELENLNNDFMVQQVHSVPQQSLQQLNWTSKGTYQFKQSIIEEEEDEDDEQFGKTNFDQSIENEFTQGMIKEYGEGIIKRSMMKKKQVRNTIQKDGILSKNSLCRNEFKLWIQKSIYFIFEGCHKDSMKSTLSLRAILYQNVVEILEEILDYIDDKFLITILGYIFKEQTYGIITNSHGNVVRKLSNLNSSKEYSQPSSYSFNQYNQQLGNNRNSDLIEDYINKDNFIDGLKELNHINEETIIKLKIMSMGNILANGIFDKILINTQKIMNSFCHNILNWQLKIPQLNLHIFYFLHQMFIYLQIPINNEFLDPSSKKVLPQQLKLKNKLDFKDFYARIVIDISTHLRQYLKDGNAQVKIKQQDNEQLTEALTPFYIKEIILPFPQQWDTLLINLKYLLKKMTFSKPFSVYYEKKKLQVFRKMLTLVMESMTETYDENIGKEYHKSIQNIRSIFFQILALYLQIKDQFKKTSRSTVLVQDQLPIKSNQLVKNFSLFWRHFQSIGQPWMILKKRIKEILIIVQFDSEKYSQAFMTFLAEFAEQEFKKTQSIFISSDCVLKIFTDLQASSHFEKQKKLLYDLFQTSLEATESFKTNETFVKILSQKLIQMKKLAEAIENYNNACQVQPDNCLYKTYCQTNMMTVLYELHLFSQFEKNKRDFKKNHLKLGDYSEMAFTDIKYLQIIQKSEDLKNQLGQREIKALIQIELMKDIVDNLNKAELFEKAIEVLGWMKDLQENFLFDYEKVEQSKIYKTISEKPNRNYAVYFKLGFFGQSLPEPVRNKEFIYRAKMLSKRGDVSNEIKKYFEGIELIEHTKTPSDEIIEGEKAYFQLCLVNPLTFREIQDFNLEYNSIDQEEIDLQHKVQYLPEKFKIYYYENFKDKFYRETVIKTKVEDELESDILIEIFRVQEKFPTLFKMQRIIKTKQIKLNAIDQAQRIVVKMNDNLLQIFKQINNSQNSVGSNIQESINLQIYGEKLMILIKGTLESPISGGLQRIIKTFFNDQYMNSTEKPKILELFSKIEEYTQTLQDGIQIYSQLCDDDRIITKFDKDFLKFKQGILELKLYIEDFNYTKASNESFLSDFETN